MYTTLLKKSLFVSVLILFASMSKAQTFKAAIVAGPNFCQVDGDRFGGYNKLGFHAGVRVFTEIDNQWAGGFDLLYSTKGSKKPIDPEDPAPQIFVISSQYVEMPLWAKHKLPAYEKVGLIFGPVIGANVGGTVDDGVSREANFKTVELSLNIGAEYEISEDLSVSLRHSNSINRIGDDFPNARRFVNRVGLFNRLYMASVIYNL